MNWKSHLVVLSLLVTTIAARADTVWQWSTAVGTARAFLWIPPQCKQVRAVIVGQNNMLEEGILQHPFFRKILSELGIAEIFVAPVLDAFQIATNNDAANERFDETLKSLAREAEATKKETFAAVANGKFILQRAIEPWSMVLVREL